MSKAAELALHQMVLGTSLVQPVSTGSKGGSVWVLSRQLVGQEKPWLRLIESLLERAAEQNLDLHVCRRYVHKNGKMVFGWHVEVNGSGVKDVLRAVEKLRAVFEEAKPSLEDDLPPPAPTTVRPMRSPVVHVQEEREERPYTLPADPGKSVLAQGAIKVTRLGRDDRGKEMTIEEMALPHVSKEMNIPKHNFGRGARTIRGESD